MPPREKFPTPKPIESERTSKLKNSGRVRSLIFQTLIWTGILSGSVTLDKLYNDSGLVKGLSRLLDENLKQKVTENAEEELENLDKNPKSNQVEIEEVAEVFSTDDLIKKLNSIKYENHAVLTNLDRAVFCIFFNEFLKGKEIELRKLWQFVLREDKGGELNPETEKEINEIVAEVLNIQRDFSQKSIFTKEGLASKVLPTSKGEITDGISSFLAGEKNTQNVQTGFKRVFEVIDRNPGLKTKLQELIKSMIEAIKLEVISDATNGSEQEKEEAKQLIHLLIDTLEVLSEQK